jgi:hypothetical protein
MKPSYAIVSSNRNYNWERIKCEIPCREEKYKLIYCKWVERVKSEFIESATC